WTWRGKALFLVLALFLLALLVRAVCPPFTGDATGYHLSAAQHYLQAGRFHYLPTLVYTNWPLGVQMHFAFVLGLDRSAPPAIVEFLFGALLIALLYVTVQRLIGRAAGVGAISLLLIVDSLSRNGICYQMTTAMVDLGLTLYATCA